MSNNLVKLAVAFGAGALVMYLFDPVTRRRRRLQSQADVLATVDDFDGLDDLPRAQSRRTVDRLRAAAIHAREQALAAEDERLEARIRTRLGRLLDRPGDVDVGVDDGFVVLSGRVKVSEIDQVIDEISGLRGVEELESRLTTRLESTAEQGEETARH